MSDQQAIFLVLILFYLLECARWIPLTARMLVKHPGLPWRVGKPVPGITSATGGLFWEPLFPWRSFALPSSAIPAALIPGGLLLHRPIRWEGRSTRTFLPWDDIQTCEAVQSKLRINGQTAWKSIHPLAARQQSALLRQLTESKPSDRARLIQTHDVQASNPDWIKERWKEVQSKAGTMSLLSTCMFAYLFLLWLPVALTQSMQDLWLFFVAGLFLLSIPGSLLFRNFHGACFPDAAEERFNLSFMIALYPPYLMRASQALVRSLFLSCDPLAVQVAFLPTDKAKRLLEREWRKLSFPKSAEKGRASIAPELTWHRAQRMEILRQLAGSLHIEMESLDQEPQKESSDCLSYCPRCLAQFTQSLATCPDCRGVELRTW